MPSLTATMSTALCLMLHKHHVTISWHWTCWNLLLIVMFKLSWIMPQIDCGLSSIICVWFCKCFFFLWKYIASTLDKECWLWISNRTLDHIAIVSVWLAIKKIPNTKKMWKPFLLRFYIASTPEPTSGTRYLSKAITEPLTTSSFCPSCLMGF